MIRLTTAVIVCILPLLPLHGGPKETERESKLHPLVQQALGWLPVDIETVIVSQGSFEVPFKQSGKPEDALALDGQATSALAVPLKQSGKPEDDFRGLPVSLLGAIRKGILGDELKGRKLTHAVEGSRRFRSPNNLGMMPFEGCQILQFEKESAEAVKAAFRSCIDRADATNLIAGNKVAIFSERLEDDDWTLLVAHPRPQILLCATDRAFLEEVLKRMDGQGAGRALPESLSEWKQVNVSAPVWAVRHYRKETAADDPSSPLGPASAANRPDPQAIGFVFWYDPKSANPLTARYLSKAPNAQQLVDDVWQQPGEHLMPKITAVARSVVEVSVKAGKEDGWIMFHFILLHYVGHGVYL